ncbi:protocadherin beta-3-like isoform X2 [Anopheles aquasalis]|uniref:protocadherin beta-3-like isoform X2 n=1 Tax=Anopheles aquasalis TaxID=42839 RepID=UPI00215A86F1|nr:protocadherin beta-3-like isoform X2 [Anopheles aquasalis]
MLFYLLLALCCSQFSTAQDCASPSFSFVGHVNPEELDLTTLPGTVIASFPVENVRSVRGYASDNDTLYLDVRLSGTELQFFTTEHFPKYEEHEILLAVLLQAVYTCTSTEKRGFYRQSFKLANNHAPKFLADNYRAQVPLPLPKNFDISPFLADGKGVRARDIDLVNNSVIFTVRNNNYIYVESQPVQDDPKEFKAILRFKDQVLKMPDILNLTLTATDQGVPPKASQVNVVIEPDITIIYDDPPMFKETFVNVTIDENLLITLELIPGTKTDDVRYSIEGPDSLFFKHSVWSNNTGLDLELINVEALPATKGYLNIVAIAQRSELQRATSVILITIPHETGPEIPTEHVEKVLSVLHLEEMTNHNSVFPLAFKHCMYTVESQEPGSYFYADDSKNFLSATPFDRENEQLFAGLEYPQFWIVLKLACDEKVRSNVGANHTTPNGPMRDIEYSTVRTHLNVIVEDINDNSPVFSYPQNNACFAYPSGQLSERILPEQLLKVEATDRDFGLNAIIRYTLSENDYFGIDPKTGVMHPLRTALSAGTRIDLQIFATDRDGASDGNTSSMTICVVGASEDQLAVMIVDELDPPALQEMLDKLGEMKGYTVRTLRNVHSVAQQQTSTKRQSSKINSSSTAIVYAFDESYLLTHSELVSLIESSETTLPSANILRVNDLFAVQQPPIPQGDSTVLYPYIIVAAFCGVLALSMAAAAFYYRAKLRNSLARDPHDGSKRCSDNSSAPIVENAHVVPPTNPPSDEAKGQEALRTPVRSLSDLLSIDEVPEKAEAINSPRLADSRLGDSRQKKSLTFNERVEKIEIFERL